MVLNPINIQTLISTGVVSSMLVGLLPLHLVRQKMAVASQLGHEDVVAACSLLVIRLALSLFAGIVMPLMMLSTTSSPSFNLNLELIRSIVAVVAWLPAIAFVVISGIMIVYGVEALLPDMEDYVLHQKSTIDLTGHRKIAVAVALTLVAIFLYSIEVCGLANVEAWANSHRLLHTTFSVFGGLGIGYVAWVVIEHFNPSESA